MSLYEMLMISPNNRYHLAVLRPSLQRESNRASKLKSAIGKIARSTTIDDRIGPVCNEVRLPAFPAAILRRADKAFFEFRDSYHVKKR